MNDTHKLLMTLIDALGLEVVVDNGERITAAQEPEEGDSEYVRSLKALRPHHIVEPIYKVVPKPGDLKDNEIIKAIAKAMMDVEIL